VPYVSKATGAPLARYAAMIAAGKTLEELGFTDEPQVDGFFVKEAVLPFQKFPGADARLGPEMRSTGEVMGHAASFGHAFAKAELAAGTKFPLEGTAFISVNPNDQSAIVTIARELVSFGFRLLATRGTAEALQVAGLPVEVMNKVSEGSPHVVDAIRAGDIDLIINTPRGGVAHEDGMLIRGTAALYGVTLITTLSAALAVVQGIRALKRKPFSVRSLQVHHESQT
jgi:carbamoyl-phosphate synthase large subunit